MPDLSQSARGYLEDLSHQPGARAPATLGEIWDSEWKRGGLDTISGLGKPLSDAQDELVTAIETAAGKPLAQYAAEKGVLFSNRFGTDQHIATLNALADTLPEESRKAIDPLRDVRGRSMKNAQKIEKDAADVSSATYGMAGTATAWAAGIARQAVDPVNLALMAATAPIGGPITGGAVKFIAGQAVAGAVAQAAVEPVIEPTRAALGLESGFGRAATNILEAGIGGAVLGGGFVGLHRMFRAGARAYRGESVAPEVTARPLTGTPLSDSPSPIVRHPELTAGDFEAAALHAERDAVIEGQRPAAIDPVAHAEGVSQARKALESGYPVGLDPDNPASWVIRNKETREVIMETFDPKKVSAMNTAKYEAVPIADYLGQLNKEIAAQPELPLAKPIEPKGPPVEVKDVPEVIGDPALAREVETRLAALSDADKQVFHVEQPDKSLKSGSAKSLLKEITDDAKAVSELVDCIGKEPA